MSLVLYQHPFALYCWKALIALYERDVPFTGELVEADRSALAALWPPASIPLLVDDGVVVPESSIIVEHLDRHGNAPPLIPSDPDTALQARRWAIAWSTITWPPRCRRSSATPCDPPTERTRTASLRPTPPSTSPTPRWISQLDGRDHDRWLAGDDFTIAECAAAPSLHYADVVHRLDREEHPALAAYLGRLLTRSSVARVIEEARPYRALFPLPWPEHVS